MEKLGDFGMQLYNVSRSFMAGVADFSGTLMQNMLFAYRHPIITAKNFGKQVRMFASENAFKLSQEEIATRSTYQAMKNGKVAITDVGPIVTQREEAFMSSLAEKIPGFGRLVRATGRTYTGFLNRMRADVFDQLYYSAKAMGKDVDDQAFLRSLGDFINNGTGRGSLGKFEGSANALSQGLFSARKLVASAQMINPIWYIKADPFVRKEALKTMVAFVGGGMTIVTLADLMGAEVGKDPTSADFGKIKIGNTRFNVFGTYQQLAVLLARLWKGYATSSTTGRKMMLGDESTPYAPTRLDLLTRFFESKEHPTLSLILSAMRGTNQIGQPFDLAPETLNRFIPMVLADGYDLYKEHGPVGLLGLMPAILGIPTQTYGTQIPSLKTSPTGKVSTKLAPTGGIAEDVVNLLRGASPSNIPEAQWPTYLQAKDKETQLKIQTEEAKRLLETGESSTALQPKTLSIEGQEYTGFMVGDKFIYINENGEQDTFTIPPMEWTPPKVKFTGIKELDKLEISGYKSDITKRIKEIGTLLDMGLMTQDQASVQVGELAKLKVALSAPKKLKVKQPKFVPIKFGKRKKITGLTKKKGVKLVRAPKLKGVKL
jgi:hypothetical protein